MLPPFSWTLSNHLWGFLNLRPCAEPQIHNVFSVTPTLRIRQGRWPFSQAQHKHNCRFVLQQETKRLLATAADDQAGGAWPKGAAGAALWKEGGDSGWKAQRLGDYGTLKGLKQREAGASILRMRVKEQRIQWVIDKLLASMTAICIWLIISPKCARLWFLVWRLGCLLRINERSN